VFHRLSTIIINNSYLTKVLVFSEGVWFKFGVDSLGFYSYANSSKVYRSVIELWKDNFIFFMLFSSTSSTN